MRKLSVVILAAVVLATWAFAGERRFLGKITLLADGGATTNATTNAAVSTLSDGGQYYDGGQLPFVIPPGAKLTVIPDDGIGILTDNQTCTYQSCMPIAGQQIFPTSVGSALTNVPTLTDGGGIQATALIVIKSTDGGGYGVNGLRIWERTGTE